ncbi:hypothetical protein ERJ75_001423200 [Trypanosoma vivax]|uniref:Uncharacterized protein n=1 Tax=Trypanosoma vivax (strain Y486) TaxID=1055687 RepID=G0TUK2_TRYVY|nr:hypothetical protein TRVL_07292 [Trypanosoma vivax]KAH8606986.1 hypothetical protein ERJ75_001423200 [Trypanosoma vivax]CCC47636.1 conserved hypothetical protein [Trypanosoma vivax Y486]
MWGAISDLVPPGEVTPCTASSSISTRGGKREREGTPTRGRVRPSPTGIGGVGPSCLGNDPRDVLRTSKDKDMRNGENTAGRNNHFNWESLSLQLMKTAFYRGAAVLEVPSGLKSKTTDRPSSDTLPREIDVKLWDLYWENFSYYFASLVDDLREQLEREGEPNEKRRCVLVTACMPTKQFKELFKSKLVNYAHLLGALETVDHINNTVVLQFTSHTSAELYHAWAASLSIKDLFGDSCTLEGNNIYNKLQVAMATHDKKKPTPTLELGKYIVLSPPYVEHLFKGIFDAEEIIYHSGSFRIRFGHTLEAKVALHALQRSMLEVFGLSLSFV